MEILKNPLLFCDGDRSNNDHLVSSLTVERNSGNLVACMNQQNDMNQQNCVDTPKESDLLNIPPLIDGLSSKIPTSNDRPYKQKEKKIKKVKSNKSQWRKQKDNKYLNKPYRNYKGIEIQSKKFVDYDCQCTMKCRETLSAKDRKQEFQKFWELGSYEAQAIFLIARVDEQTTKRSTKKNKERTNSDGNSGTKKSKRQFSRTYILKSKQVCRDMFVKTLGITSKRINTALVKMRSKKLIDQRGLSQGGKNRISDDRYDQVVQHIKKMPRYKCCHMQDKHDNDFLNLPPELSLSKMYELYAKEVGNPVSLSMYKKIYYGKFNFKAKGVKREICNICKSEKKVKSAELKKQHAVEKLPMPNSQTLSQEQYIIPNYVQTPSHTLHCSQSWLPTPNFQMPQHSASHYFEQPVVYDMN